MDVLTVFFIGVGLSMDALAVSVCGGMASRDRHVKRAVVFGSAFGFFQFFMVFLGWFAGTGFASFVKSFDHWIAFGLLVLVGGKMFFEAFKPEEEKNGIDAFDIKTLLLLSIATSIDALAVGISFAFLYDKIIVWPALLIGMITFLISFAGAIFGKTIGRLLGNKVEIAGALILIGIGIKILFEHLKG